MVSTPEVTVEEKTGTVVFRFKKAKVGLKKITSYCKDKGDGGGSYLFSNDPVRDHSTRMTRSVSTVNRALPDTTTARGLAAGV